jgi:hypothetical protein
MGWRGASPILGTETRYVRGRNPRWKQDVVKELTKTARCVRCIQLRSSRELKSRDLSRNNASTNPSRFTPAVKPESKQRRHGSDQTGCQSTRQRNPSFPPLCCCHLAVMHGYCGLKKRSGKFRGQGTMVASFLPPSSAKHIGKPATNRREDQD